MQINSVIYFVILCIVMAYSIIKPWLSRDKAEIWSPITMIVLTLGYYVVKPSFGNLDLFSANNAPNQQFFYISSLLFFISILVAFKRTSGGTFNKWNQYFNTVNAPTISVFLFLFALLCYVPFRGFRYSIDVNDATIMSERVGLVSYFIDLISLFVAASCIAFVGLKRKTGLGLKNKAIFLIILYISLVIFIVAGFRFRIVILLLAMATVYHLYPQPRSINYKVFVPLAIVMYLGFAIMDTARTYGAGIDLETAQSVSLSQAYEGAHESESVCCFSINVIDAYSRNADYIYFEPLLTAVLMPLPRAFFPWKPDAGYLKDIQIRTLGDASGGAACLSYVEGYISFGIFGVILYGLLVGWLCKKIWSNYRNNPDSIGAILLLALFNGFCYVWISRGYMAAAFNSLIYFVVMPFWLTGLINKFKKYH